MRSSKEEFVKKDVLMPDGSDKDRDSKINDSVHPTVLSSSQNHAMPSLSVPSFFVCFRFSGLHGSTAADSVQSGWPDVVSSCSRAKRHLRTQAQLSESRTETLGLLRKREKSEQRKTEVLEQAFPSRIHGNPSQADAARHLNVSRSVVQRLWDQYQSEDSVSRRPVPGRLRATTHAEDRFLALSARRRTTTVPQLVADHFQASGRRISATTVRNRLHNAGLYARRPVVCVPLNGRQ
ncbi:HTH_Tnp_Tc3_2 domain-containing protein [Trichonephila clavipes]|nr:HTH_Tnp_Tc3_2 domain-containing protein [Trichonephila clavipes]